MSMPLRRSSRVSAKTAAAADTQTPAVARSRNQGKRGSKKNAKVPNARGKNKRTLDGEDEGGEHELAVGRKKSRTASPAENMPEQPNEQAASEQVLAEQAHAQALVELEVHAQALAEQAHTQALTEQAARDQEFAQVVADQAAREQALAEQSTRKKSLVAQEASQEQVAEEQVEQVAQEQVTEEQVKQVAQIEQVAQVAQKQVAQAAQVTQKQVAQAAQSSRSADTTAVTGALSTLDLSACGENMTGTRQSLLDLVNDPFNLKTQRKRAQVNMAEFDGVHRSRFADSVDAALPAHMQAVVRSGNVSRVSVASNVPVRVPSTTSIASIGARANPPSGVCSETTRIDPSTSVYANRPPSAHGTSVTTRTAHVDPSSGVYADPVPSARDITTRARTASGVYADPVPSARNITTCAKSRAAQTEPIGRAGSPLRMDTESFPNVDNQDHNDHDDDDDDDNPADDYAATAAREEEHRMYLNRDRFEAEHHMSQDEMDEQHDLETQGEAISEIETGMTRKKPKGAGPRKSSKKRKGRMVDDIAVDKETTNEVTCSKPGPLSAAVKAASEAAYNTFLATLQDISAESKKPVDSLLGFLGLLSKATRDKNRFNMFCSWYANFFKQTNKESAKEYRQRVLQAYHEYHPEDDKRNTDELREVFSEQFDWRESVEKRNLATTDKLGGLLRSGQVEFQRFAKRQYHEMQTVYIALVINLSQNPMVKLATSFIAGTEVAEQAFKSNAAFWQNLRDEVDTMVRWTKFCGGRETVTETPLLKNGDSSLGKSRDARRKLFSENLNASANAIFALREKTNPSVKKLKDRGVRFTGFVPWLIKNQLGLVGAPDEGNFSWRDTDPIVKNSLGPILVAITDVIYEEQEALRNGEDVSRFSGRVMRLVDLSDVYTASDIRSIADTAIVKSVSGQPLLTLAGCEAYQTMVSASTADTAMNSAPAPSTAPPQHAAFVAPSQHVASTLQPHRAASIAPSTLPSVAPSHRAASTALPECVDSVPQLQRVASVTPSQFPAAHRLPPPAIPYARKPAVNPSSDDGYDSADDMTKMTFVGEPVFNVAKMAI